MRKKCFSKKINPPTPTLFLNVGNSIKREENMKSFFFQIYKNSYKKFKQHSINIKNYTAHPHDMVHVPAKFRENTSMRFRVSAKTKHDERTDRRTFGAAGDNKGKQFENQFFINGPKCKKNIIWAIWGARRVFNDQIGHILLSSYPLTHISMYMSNKKAI